MRSAVVIGGGRGIGAATARLLAASGHHVTIVDRASDDPRLPYAMSSLADLDASVAAARSVAAEGAEVSSAVADACDEAAITAIVAETEARTGGLDAMVITAGVIAGGVPIWEMPADQLEAVMDIDIHAVIAAARAGVPALLRREAPRAGRFVAVASTAATRGLPMLSAYCAAKAGVVGLVQAMGAELRGTGVTANAVSPGSTDTAILAESARLYDLPEAGTFAYQQPIERLIDPEEIARIIAYLAGPESGAVTGADYAVDGGLSI